MARGLRPSDASALAQGNDRLFAIDDDYGATVRVKAVTLPPVFCPRRDPAGLARDVGIVTAPDESKAALRQVAEIPRCGWDLNPRMTVLQTVA
jgi:hypothetical protein